MADNNIRIRIEFTGGQGGSSGLDGILRTIDTSIQYAANKISGTFGSAISRGMLEPFNQVNKAINQINANLTQMILNMQKAVQAGGGLPGAGGSRGTGGPNVSNLNDQFAQLANGFFSTGRQSQTVTPAGSTTRDEYLNAMGRRMMATNGPNGLSRVAFGLDPDPGIAQRQRAEEYAAQLAFSQQQRDAVTQANNARTLQQYGLRPTNDTLSAAGNHVTQYGNGNFMGSSAELNQVTGQLTTHISLLDRVRSGITTAFAPLRGVKSIWDGIGDSMLRMAGTIYTIERAISLMEAPFKRLYDLTGKIVAATEIQRQFATNIAPIAGSPEAARQITSDVVGLARGTPLTSADLLQNARRAAFAPGLSSQVAFGGPSQIAGSLASYSTLLERGALLTQDQNPQSFENVALQFLSGSSLGARRRLGVDPQTIADAIGRTLPEVLANPTLGYQALSKFTQQRVGDSAFTGRLDLVSTNASKVLDALQQGLAKIGNAGLYDALNDRLRGLTDLILDSFDPKKPQFAAQASRISDSMMHIWDNLFSFGSNLLSRFSGNNNPITSAAEGLAQLTEAGAHLSDMLPALGDAFGEIGKGIGALVSKVYAVFSTGFSTSIKVGGQDIPIEFGNAGEIARTKDQLSTYQALNGWSAPNEESYMDRMYHTFGWTKPSYANDPRDYSGQIAALQGHLKDLQGSGDGSFLGSLSNLMGPLTGANLGAKYASRRSADTALSNMLAGTNQPKLNALSDILNRTGGNFEFDDKYSTLLRQPQATIDQLKASGASYSSILSANRNDIDTLIGIREGDPQYSAIGEKLTKAYGDQTPDKIDSMLKQKQNDQQSILAFPDIVARSLQNMAGALAESLKDLPPGFAKDGLIDRSIEKMADDISDALQLTGEDKEKVHNAIKSAPVALQRTIDEAVFQNVMRGAQIGLPDQLPLGATGLVGINRDDNYRNAAQAKAVSDYLNGKLIPRYTDLSAKASNEADPLGPNHVELQAAGAQILQYQDQLQQLQRTLDDTQKSFEGFASSVRDSMEHGLGDAIYSLATGAGNLQDVFRSMAQSILHDLTNLSAHLLVQGLVGNLGQPQQSGGVGTGGGLFGAGLGSLVSVLGNIITGGLFSSNTIPTDVAADISPAGPTPRYVVAPAFAGGGVVDRPTLAMVGDNVGNSEAIIPMKGGHVPVAFTGKGGNSNEEPFKLFIVSDLEAAVAQGYRKNKDGIVSMLAGDAKFQKMIRRGG